jgi:hypothetical protein
VPLSGRDHEILEFERSWWTEPGPKEHRIRERFGLSPGRYRQILGALTESPEAMAHDPLLIRRLRRLRSARRRTRHEGAPVTGRRGP